MTGIGARLLKIRQQWQLSLRDVEERSARFAQEQGNLSYKVSASWLNRLEREARELTVSRLIALAEIYNIPAEHLLRSINPEVGKTQIPTSVPQPPDETTLWAPEEGRLTAPYQRGIIGKRDLTLDPMIPAGSVVHIDTRDRAISLRRDWAHEFHRPIYFLRTREGCVCGWCELDKNSEWLTLIPHPMSTASSRRWKYWTEIESVGRVVAVAIRLL
jgi:transcriptional regulator with XRE-family HTH domain